MEPLCRKSLHGSWAAVLLPLNRDFSIDYVKLTDEIETLISAEPDGIYSNGSASEFHNQTEDEFDKINQILVEKCTKASIPFQIGINNTNPTVTINRLQKFKTSKPGAFQIILPDWIVPSAIEIDNYLNKLAETAFPIGLVLYNPGHAKKVFTPEEHIDLILPHNAVIGSKLGGSKIGWYKEMAEVLEEMAIFVPGHHLATGVTHGAKGSYSNIACLNPFLAQKWYNLMKSDIKKALRIEKELQSFITDHILPFSLIGYNDTALDKLLATIGNWGPMNTLQRWPYQSIPMENAIKLREVAKAELEEFYNLE